VGHEDFRQQMRDRFINEDDVKPIQKYYEKSSTLFVRINKEDDGTQRLKDFINNYKDFYQEDQHLIEQIKQSSGLNVVLIGINLEDKTLKYFAGMELMNLIGKLMNDKSKGPYSLEEFANLSL
jgi:DNA-directed RNA polymerase sigma subunit (sigma70/sigma32)